MESLKGKTALVTGATSGIGLAIASALLKEGVKTYAIGRHLQKAKDDLKAFDGGHFISVDLTIDDDLDYLFYELKNESIDILIHCAGVLSMGDFEKEKVEDFDLQYHVNVRAPFVITQQLLPKLKESKGDIVFINSTAGLDAWEKISTYAASKHALRAMTDSLRKEVAEKKVRVASLYLGSVDTPMQEYVQQLSGKKTYDPSKYMKTEDIAEAVLTVLKMPEQASITDMTIRQNT